MAFSSALSRHEVISKTIREYGVDPRCPSWAWSQKSFRKKPKRRIPIRGSLYLAFVRGAEWAVISACSKKRQILSPVPWSPHVSSDGRAVIMGLRDETACYSHDLIGHKLTSFLFWFLRLNPISAPQLLTTLCNQLDALAMYPLSSFPHQRRCTRATHSLTSRENLELKVSQLLFPNPSVYY